ncbi:ABC transporter permease [Streptomyces buecherae]|uniref:ABC transporter permease n=1 Tax=Streptomyces buecherae TaxID=2763006 RepID=A0A7H8NJN7_9ACTN|nr:ABC transporter permease [Streptomyces buecherae]QKW54784.1 ABC transporter permease [Streptomyces buecherae]
MTMAVATQVLRSEWTKIRSVQSTGWTLALALVVTVALSMLLSALSKKEYGDMSPREKLEFDPTLISFAGIGLGQLALIVFGVLVVSNEYSTGMIRTSLAAVPQRMTFLASKITVATLLALVAGLVISFASFYAGQAMLGEHKASIGDSGVLRAMIGSALYMTLITMFAMGVTAMLRSPMVSLGILMPFFFLISNILGNVPATEKVGRYLPDQAGSRIMQVVRTDDDAPYGPWGGLAIMAAWVAVALIGGALALKKRDA